MINLIKRYFKLAPIKTTLTLLPAYLMAIEYFSGGMFDDRTDYDAITIFGLATAYGIYNLSSTRRDYKNVSEYIEERGFPPIRMKDRRFRKYASVYAQENDKLIEFEEAIDISEGKTNYLDNWQNYLRKKLNGKNKR